MIGTALLYAAAARAQLNESDTLRLQFRSALTGNLQSGNVSLLSIRGRLDGTLGNAGSWVFKSQNSGLYQVFYHVQADMDLFSRNYLYYRPEQRVYPFAIAYVSSNYRRKVNSRYFAGAGATWQLWRAPGAVIKVSGSMVYEETDFAGNVFNHSTFNGTKKLCTWRGTLYSAGWVFLGERHLKMFYDAFWQPSLSAQSNYRWQLETGMDLPVWKGLFFTVLYTLTHENLVVQPVRQKDRLLTFGLGYQFKKI